MRQSWHWRVGTASGVGTGGMRTKIEAARIATNAGIRTIIARGRLDRVIEDVASGQPLGTTFLPHTSELKPALQIDHGAKWRRVASS